MKQITHRITSFSMRTRTEMAQVVKIEQGENGQAQPVIEDGMPVTEDVEVEIVEFVEPDTGEAYAFFADQEFKLDMIRVLAASLTEENRQKFEQMVSGTKIEVVRDLGAIEQVRRHDGG